MTFKTTDLSGISQEKKGARKDYWKIVQQTKNKKPVTILTKIFFK